jgi:hypothetical protein
MALSDDIEQLHFPTCHTHTNPLNARAATLIRL